MTKIQNRILTALFTIITFPICSYIFSLIWDYLKLSSLKNDNIFVYTSECDPKVKNPSIIIAIIIFITSIMLSRLVIYIMNNFRNKTQKSTTN